MTPLKRAQLMGIVRLNKIKMLEARLVEAYFMIDFWRNLFINTPEPKKGKR